MVPDLGRPGSAKTIFMKGSPGAILPADRQRSGAMSTGGPRRRKAERRLGHHLRAAHREMRRRIRPDRKRLPAPAGPLEQRRCASGTPATPAGAQESSAKRKPAAASASSVPGARCATASSSASTWRGGVKRIRPSSMVARLSLSPGSSSASMRSRSSAGLAAAASSHARCCGTSRSKRRKGKKIDAGSPTAAADRRRPRARLWAQTRDPRRIARQHHERHHQQQRQMRVVAEVGMRRGRDVAVEIRDIREEERGVVESRDAGEERGETRSRGRGRAAAAPDESRPRAARAPKKYDLLARPRRAMLRRMSGTSVELPLRRRAAA